VRIVRVSARSLTSFRIEVPVSDRELERNIVISLDTHATIYSHEIIILSLAIGTWTDPDLEFFRSPDSSSLSIELKNEHPVTDDDLAKLLVIIGVAFGEEMRLPAPPAPVNGSSYPGPSHM